MLGVLFLEAALAICFLSEHCLGPYWTVRDFTPHPPIIAKAPVGTFQILKQFEFKSQESIKSWEEKTFKGKTFFQVQSEGGNSFLRCQSQDAASGLFQKTEHKITPNLFLSWRWRAIQFPQKKEPDRLSNRSEDDFAARLYVIFPGSNYFKSDVIEYLWDEKIPPGTSASSPYSERVKLFVIRSGATSEIEGGWVEEERNLWNDYRQLFGNDPQKSLGVIAVMSDSDNTKTQSSADIGTIHIKRGRNANTNTVTGGEQ